MVRTRLGENGADRGSGLGPWTVHASFKAEDGGIRDVGLDRAAAREGEGSNSRYAEPEADGIRPVLRTRSLQFSLKMSQWKMSACKPYISFVIRWVVVGVEPGL